MDLLDAVGGLASEESRVVHLQPVDAQPGPEPVLVPGLEPFDRQPGLGLLADAGNVRGDATAPHRRLVHVPLDAERRRFAGHLAVELHRLARVPRDVVQLPHEPHDACGHTSRATHVVIVVLYIRSFGRGGYVRRVARNDEEALA